MSDLVETSYEAYKDAYSRYLAAFDLLTKNNVSCDPDTGIFTTYTAEPVGVFIPLRELIQWAVSVYIRSDDSCLSGHDKSFMSGIKHVDNIMKHEEMSVQIDQLLKSCVKFKGEVKKYGELGVFSPSFSLTCIWEDISFIPVDKKYKRQRKNYNKYLKGQLVTEVVEELNQIIEKCIVV